MKIRKNYNQTDSGGNGSATAEVPAEGDFSSWKIPEDGLTGVDTGDTSETAAEETPAGEEGAEGAAGEEKPAGTEKAAGSEKPAAEEGAEGEEPAGDDTPLTLKEDAAIDEPEATWEEAAKTFELPEIEGSNLTGQDKFHAQIKKSVEIADLSGYERGKQEVEAKYAKDFSPQAQAFTEALNGGMSYEDAVKPAHGFYSAASGTDEEIMTLYFTTALKQEATLAEDSVAQLEASGLLKIEASKIRAQLLNKAEEVVNQNVKTYSEKFAAEKSRIAKETERENSEVKAEIMSREKFLDGIVDQKTREQIAKRWESGYYKKLMQNDKKSVADFIFFKEFGEAQFKKAKATAEKDAKLGTFKKLAHTPKTPSGSQNSDQPIPVGDFSVWGTVKPTGVEHG